MEIPYRDTQALYLCRRYSERTGEPDGYEYNHHLSADEASDVLARFGMAYAYHRNGILRDAADSQTSGEKYRKTSAQVGNEHPDGDFRRQRPGAEEGV